jgi:hypothetical protein
LRRKIEISLLIIFTAIGTGRIIAGYSQNSQAFDEPAHVASGLEWLDRGTYLIDPLHPPLARVAIALPLYFAGLRLPEPAHPPEKSISYFRLGNLILYQDGQYWRNLTLARLGVLPFFFTCTWFVYRWTRREFGMGAALLAVVLLTSLPEIITFAGVAYTDLPAAVMQLALLFVFTRWLDDPSLRVTVLLGVAAGLAFLTAFTTLIFFPAAAIGLFITWIISVRREPTFSTRRRQMFAQLPIAVFLGVILIWSGYRFSFKPVVEGMHLSRSSFPSFQHLPSPVRWLARAAVTSDPRIPAPEMILGFAQAYVVTHSGAKAYILGKEHAGGVWYFFPVGLFFKNPLPFLLLSVVGVFVSFRTAGRWTVRAPGAALLSILSVSMLQNYDAGQRHVLVAYPLMALLAGAAGAFLWGRQASWHRALLVALLIWQGVATWRAGLEPMAYFNEFAGSDPSRILITGCDLDCGQDVARLGRELRSRSVEKVHVAMWSSADLDKMNLARQVEVLQPNEPVSGWVAVSPRSVKLGDVLHISYPPGSFSWLQPYKPVANAGATIRIYCIPASGTAERSLCPP